MTQDNRTDLGARTGRAANDTLCKMLGGVLGSFAAGAALAFNFYTGKPLYAQLYRTLLLTGFGYGVGYGIELVHERRKRVHLIAIENYKSLFPERIPVKISQTYNDVLSEWRPKR